MKTKQTHTTYNIQTQNITLKNEPLVTFTNSPKMLWITVFRGQEGCYCGYYQTWPSTGWKGGRNLRNGNILLYLYCHSGAEYI